MCRFTQLCSKTDNSRRSNKGGQLSRAMVNLPLPLSCETFLACVSRFNFHIGRCLSTSVCGMTYTAHYAVSFGLRDRIRENCYDEAAMQTRIICEEVVDRIETGDVSAELSADHSRRKVRCGSKGWKRR